MEVIPQKKPITTQSSIFTFSQQLVLCSISCLAHNLQIPIKRRIHD